MLLGGVMALSNLYVGMKTGWGLGVTITACILAFGLFSSLQRLIPALTSADIHPAGAGVRAQAVLPSGALVDDFRIEHGERMVHVLNAPSPAATASIAIGRHVAGLVVDALELNRGGKADALRAAVLT
jgi:L-2-hydroxyglutarate oxidase